METRAQATTPPGIRSLDDSKPTTVRTRANDPTAGQARVGDRREVIRRREALFRRALVVADVIAATVALTLNAAVFGEHGLTLGAATVPFLFVIVAKASGLYDRDEHLLHRTTLDEFPALFGLATLATLLVYLGNGFFVDGELSRLQVFGTWSTLIALLVSLRTMARAVGLRFAAVERCLLLGDPQAATYLRHILRLSPAVKAELVSVITPDPGFQDHQLSTKLPHNLGPILEARGIDRVILAMGAIGRDESLYTIRELKEWGVKVSVLPEASRVAGSSVELDHLHGITLLGMRRFEFTRSSRIIKRAVDVAGSGLALIALAPILCCVAIAIRIDSPGPVLFRQRRVGRHGDEFSMFKFRSMVENAEQLKPDYAHLNEGAAGLFKIPADPRMTRVGRLIRRWQIDELPQLFNTLRGEMSLVGPRPLIPEEDSQIEGWYRRRLDVPPGITGHWQILGSSAQIPLDEMVKLDYLYVANWSLWGDFRLLLRTVPFILGRRGI